MLAYDASMLTFPQLPSSWATLFSAACKTVSWRLMAAIASSGAGVVAVVGGFWLWWHSQSVMSTLQPITTETAVLPSTDQALDQIVVEVSGAVTRAGLYQVNVGGRVGEAIQAAGGWSDKADHTWVARHLNLAQALTDGEKIYVPQVGEQLPDETTGSTAISQVEFSPENTVTEGGVSINTASQAELEALPGIGTKKAQALIAQRPYASLDELVTKKIVSTALLNQLQNQLSL